MKKIIKILSYYDINNSKCPKLTGAWLHCLVSHRISVQL